MAKPWEIEFHVRWRKSVSKACRYTAGVTDYPAIIDGSMILGGKRQWIVLRPIIVLHFDYPLRDPVRMTFCRPTGFRRIDLFRCIYKGYCKIYDDISKYGVYGHGIGDLKIDHVDQITPGFYKVECGS